MMPGPLQNVVVIGGSGNLGSPVLKELLAAGLNITATTRPNSSSKFPDGVKVVKSDLSEASLAEIFKGNDAVISLITTMQLPMQKTFIDAAVKAGIKRFFPGEFGSDTRTVSQDVLDLVPIFRAQLDIVRYIKEKEKDGLTWTGVVTGAFFDWGLRAGFLDFDFPTKSATIWDSGTNKVSMTNLSTIGKAITNILTSPDLVEATKNRYVNISSHTVSQKDILAAVEDITGEKWKVAKKDSKSSIAEAKEKFAAGDHSVFYDIMKGYMFGDGYFAGDLSKSEGGLWNDKLGLPKEDYKEDLKRLLQ